ncbi:glutamate 5-kinase [Desulfatibacillum aliphaticivorans]|uniref:glutamate 5-kinase n=1 Tax=Desulfatibacillum aliphaticivorans TaxID=218208 RepID=UPI0004257E16|nr:glutamate 5-kinase [Desulfatibacillum aliphaticivorans]
MKGQANNNGAVFSGAGNRKEFFSCVKRVVVKVGSGILTEETGLNLKMVKNLSQQLAELHATGREIILVSSGAVAAGVRKMQLAKRPTEIPEKQAAAAVGQASLINEYELAFEEHNVKVAQVLLTRDDLAARRRYLNARNALQTLLAWKVLPIINENDTVVVAELKFGDNDNLSAMIAQLLDVDVVINLTDIDGLYTSDPRTCSDAKIVPYVEKITSALEQSASCHTGQHGTGGMASKVIAAKKAHAAGIPMIVAGGATSGILKKIFDGEEVGTLFAPKSKKMAGKKCWLGFAANPKGLFMIDNGAANALVNNGKSLLPVGIKAVEGAFGVGAPVRVVDLDRRELGIGLTNYSSADARKIKGKPSSELECILKHKAYDEVIHRDNLVVTFEDQEENP